MWVKITKVEQSKFFWRTLCLNFLLAFGSGLIVVVIFTFFYTGVAAGNHGTFMVQNDQVPYRFPFAIFLGILFGIFYLIVLSMPKKLLVCPKCGIIKKKNDDIPCDCNVKYEDIKTMTWIEKEGK
jgi:hypothetical protein